MTNTRYAVSRQSDGSLHLLDNVTGDGLRVEAEHAREFRDAVSLAVDYDKNEKPATWPEKWAGKTWRTAGMEWGEDVLLQIYRAVEKELNPYTAMSPTHDMRIIDRGLQLLRKEELVRYDEGEWVLASTS